MMSPSSNTLFVSDSEETGCVRTVCLCDTASHRIQQYVQNNLVYMREAHDYKAHTLHVISHTQNFSIGLVDRLPDPVTCVG
jgi:hypothetical protein